MTDSAAKKTRTGPWGRFFCGLCFFVFTTLGMAVIAAALLAQPLARHWQEQRFLAQQHRQIEQLEQLYQQQEELLTRSENPGVVARAAIETLNYVPSDLPQSPYVAVPQSWPELDDALDRVEEDAVAAAEPVFVGWAQWLSDRPEKMPWLLGLGCGLVVISLTCFNPR